MMAWQAPEGAVQVAAAACYGTAAVIAWRRGHRPGLLLALAAAGVALQTVALGARWVRVGHGPFTTMHEILASNLWSLALAYVAAGARWRFVLVSARFVLPVLAMMALWMLATNPGDGHFLPTYATPLLYVHTLFGKLFLGLLLLASGLALVLMVGRTPARRLLPAQLPGDARLDDAVGRFAVTALVAQTGMLVAGAAWAQDAWGRYWAWDPLETWAFVTWVVLALAVHVRIETRRRRPGWPTGLVVASFVIAFLTFFGVPFVSVVPHQGAL